MLVLSTTRTPLDIFVTKLGGNTIRISDETSGPFGTLDHLREI